MLYSVKKPPGWLEGLPEGAVRIGVDMFNALLAEKKDEEQARMAAWAAVKARYEEAEDGTWRAKADFEGAERSHPIRFRAARSLDKEGLVWEAVLIAPGVSLGYPRFYWTDEVLEEAVDVFKGVDINAYELTADFFTHLPIPNIEILDDVKRYLVAKKVGWIEKTWFEPGAGIKAEIHLLSGAAWLADILAQGIGQGNSDVLGLSIDSRIQGMEVVVEDFTVIWVTKIISASSVDVVTYPAAGGKFIRAIAGLKNKPQEGVMDREKLLGLIEEVRPELLDGKDRAAMSDDEILELARMAMNKPEEPGKDTGKKTKTPDTNNDGQRAAQGMTPEQVEEAITKATEGLEQRAACGRMLDATLGESKLPELVQKRIRKNLDTTIFTQENLDTAIKEEKEYIASMAQPGTGLELPDQARISGGIRSVERAQMAVDRLFGLDKDDMISFARMERLDHRPFFTDVRAAQDYEGFEDVPSFTGLREMYDFFTGDTEVTGFFNRKNLPRDLRAAQDITSSTFSYVLGNTLGRRLIKDYMSANYQEDLLISIRKPVKDFRQQEAVLVGYFGDLATVDPESADYDEIAAVTDEEATYTIAQKGNILTITRKTIINDDISLIQRLVNRLGRAARRTHAKYVWNFFINNSNCSDGTAWFTSGHGNLGSNGLSFAYALTAYKALAKMTEKDSGERIGLLDDPNLKPVLVYPVDILETGESVVEDDVYYSSNDLTTKTRNPLKGKIKGASVSLLTDANDWGMLMPASVVDMVEMGYLNGRQEPEMFVADTPQSEQVFVADKIRHKIRHEYAGTPIDYISGYKAVVA